MTETLLQSSLQKIEEKMLMILSEVEFSRKEIRRLSQENAALKMDREANGKKLQELVSLLDAISGADDIVVSIGKPAVFQG